MALLSKVDDERTDELMIYQKRLKEANYYEPGDEFDGGELVFVHQTGGLVRRSNEYFIYPIGAKLDQDLSVEEAVEYPELQRAAERFRAADPPKAGAEEKPEEDAEQANQDDNAGIKSGEGGLPAENRGGQIEDPESRSEARADRKLRPSRPREKTRAPSTNKGMPNS